MTEQKKDPKIQQIQKKLPAEDFRIEDSRNGIRVTFDTADMKNCAVEIYVLKNNPKYVRAKINLKAPVSPEKENELKMMHAKLQQALKGTAVIENFHSLGSRGDIQVYYAPLTLQQNTDIENEEQLLAQKAFALLDGMDSKKFRRILDALKLPRSSIVRLALTRVFREAVDAGELQKLVAQEAGKIVKPEDIVVIEKLKDLKKVPFLSLMSNLFWINLTRRKSL